MPKKKDQSIETLRGLAILLVVAGYIIHQDITAAMGHTSRFAALLRFSYFMLTPIRMPLFTVISAYLYAASPATRETYRRLVTGKARRIMVPFLAVSTLQYATLSLLPMQNRYPLNEIYRVYVFPHEQLWFLYSIFEIFILVGVMDFLGWLNTSRKWLACLAASVCLHILFELPEALSLHGINFLMPFFLLGYGFRRYPDLVFSKKMLFLYAAVAVAAVGMRAVLYRNPFLTPNAYQAVGLGVTFSAVPLLFRFRRTVPGLAAFGYYAFGIHLFNRIVVSAARTVFEHYHYQNTLVQFAVYMTLGVLLAIVIQKALERFSITRTCVLGLKEPSPARSREHPYTA